MFYNGIMKNKILFILNVDIILLSNINIYILSGDEKADVSDVEEDVFSDCSEVSC